MSKNQRNIKLVGIAGLAIIAIAGGALVAYPLVGQSQTFAKDTAAALSANKVLEDKIKALQVTQKELPQIQALNLALSAKFPSLPNGTALLTDISTAAFNSGMDASNIKGITISAPVLLTPTASGSTTTTGSSTATSGNTTTTNTTTSGTNTGATGTSKVASMDMVIIVSGNGPQLSAFVASLGDIRRTVKINKVDLAANTDKTSNQTNMTVGATTYLYQNIEAPVTAPSSTGTNGKPTGGATGAPASTATGTPTGKSTGKAATPTSNPTP